MLLEWFTYLIADCPPPIRQMGYLHDSIGLRARYRRCQSAWQSHLQNSCSSLLASIPAAQPLDTALILGSGLLLDIPLAEIAQRFQRVLLVDLVHLPEVHRSVRRYPNVECITHDVTGFLSHLTQLSPTQLTLPTPQRFLADAHIDWVASVNLLSQLPLKPLAWLAKKFPELSETELAEFATHIMQQHLHYLAQFSAPVCLLTDIEQSTYNAAMERLEHTDFSEQFSFVQPPYNTWLWDIAPLGEIAPKLGRVHRVVAYHLK